MKLGRQLHAQAVLPQEKSSMGPLDRRLSGPQSRSGLVVAKIKKNLPMSGNKPQSSSLFTDSYPFYFPKNNFFVVLGLYNDVVSTAEFILHGMKWENNHGY
jgi:hypothetical protein